MPPIGFTSKDPGYEMHSELPDFRFFVCDIYGEGVGIGFDTKAKNVFRFSEENEPVGGKDGPIVIRDANGEYTNPASYMGLLSQMDKKALAAGLRRCGGLSIARIEKYLQKKEAVEARRPIANGSVVLRLQMA